MSTELQATDPTKEPAGDYQPPKRPQLHFSGLDKLWGCGEQYRFVYVERMRLPANPAILVGSSVDRAVTANLEAKMLTGKLLSIEEVKSIARDSVEIEWKRGVALTADEKAQGEAAVKAEATDKAIRLAALHARDVAPGINPTHVQRQWAIEIPGFPFDLVGAIDVQEGAERIRDTKTSGKTPAAGIADMSMQLTAYALAIKVLDGQAPKEVVLDYLIDNKTPKAATYRSTRTLEDFQPFMARVENAAQVIQSGSFTPAQPTDWRCNAKWCGFHSVCRYANKPKSTVIETGE